MSAPLVADIDDIHECLCISEFIQRIEEKHENARLASHFIAFMQ